MAKNIDKMNFGCGTDIMPGYLNIDFEKSQGVDVVYNLNKIPYPFKDNQFKEIIMRNILEHLDDAYAVMREIHRISKNGAIIKLRSPHFSSHNTWGDLQHKRGFNCDTFKNDNMKKLFKIEKQKITFPHSKFFMRWFANRNQYFYERNLAYIIPAIDIVIELRVIK